MPRGGGMWNDNGEDALTSLPLASLAIGISGPLFPPLFPAAAAGPSSGGACRSVDGADDRRLFGSWEEPPYCQIKGHGRSQFREERGDGHAQCREDDRDEKLLRGAFKAPPFLSRDAQHAGTAPTVMAAGSEARRRSMRTMFNEMVKRHSRVVPLGYSRGSKKGARDVDPSPLLETDELGNEVVADTGQRKVLILMSDTGGGHRASAEAIKQTFEQEFGNEYKVTVIDLWKEHTPWPFNQMPKSYSFLVKHETLWKVAFHATKPRFVHQPQMAATSAFVAREVAKGLYKYQPDVIVSVHPLMQHIPLRVLRSKGLLQRIPFTTVITDLTTCHPTWFHKLATICFCPTKDVAQRAYKAGLKSHQIRIHGLPIRPSFCKPTAPKDELRRELGMDGDLPAVILMGGGEGMGPVEATARALAKSLGSNRDTPLGQLIVICGRNKKLQAKLQAIDWPMPTLIKGFVTNMPEWMAACDCVITKAGPGTIAESMIRGLPMIINDYIAGQEVGNVPYVVENGAGKFSENPKEIAKIVAGWFGPKMGELQVMAENARKLARPDAVFKIVRDLDQLARRKDILPQAQLAFSS